MDITQLAERTGSALLARKQNLVTAESCTGGGIAEAISRVPGSSQWFDRAWVTYSNVSKVQELHIAPELIAINGAVSREVVLGMAASARRKSEASWSVAVSGVAGPDGGSLDKPVGTVWIAWAGEGVLEARCFHFEGDRSAVRQQTIVEALMGLLFLLGAGASGKLLP